MKNEEEQTAKEQKEEENKSNTVRLSPLGLFKYADNVDYLLMFIGSICAMGFGMSTMTSYNSLGDIM
jgi:hypothetical protein